MKKLISVFAALALVGSMAAAPKKPAAKPVVAAPAAAAPVAAVAASMPSASGKGIGLFIEGRGSFTLSNGSSTYGTTAGGAATGTDATWESSGTKGFGGGASIGYDILNGLALVASFDYRQVKSKDFKVKLDNASTAVGSATYTANVTTKTMVLGLGIRPHIDALGGTFYAGAGVALVLPHDDELAISGLSTTAAIVGTASSNVGYNFAATEGTYKNGWNISTPGMYAELGYNYNITSNVYFGIGARGLVATTNNEDKDVKYSGLSNRTGASVALCGGGASVCGLGGTVAVPAAPQFTDVNYTAKTSNVASGLQPQTKGITDFSAQVTVGVRF